MRQKTPDIILAAAGIVAAILVLLPFHAVLTTWAGSNFGHLDLFRIWKELLCVPLGLLCVVRLCQSSELRRRVFGSRLFWLALVYSLGTVLLGLWALQAGRVTANALIYSLLANPRLAVFMVLAWIAAMDSPWLHRSWRMLVAAPALLVISFGIMQLLVLPPDFLRHLGYGPGTIPAVQTVDQQVDFRRIQSTLRGANPLGAYLVLIITMLVGMVLRRKDQRAFGGYLVAAAGMVLLVTYSRSAYLGVLASVGFLIWHLLPGAVWRRRLALAGIAGVLVLGGAALALRHNDVVQNLVFHYNGRSTAPVSSNAGRAAALKQGLTDVVRQPFGRGPGTAGPASFRNTGHQPRIAENYYIQLAQEIGLLGLALFVAINLLVARQLWAQRDDFLALTLLASLLGITIVNFFSHAWADDTLGMLWWGLAGIVLAQPSSIITTKPLPVAPQAQSRPSHPKKSRSSKAKRSGKRR